LWNQPVVDNRASAVYALRSYLRICTPYTIANQINTTVTLVERGAGGAVLANPMVNARVVGTTTLTANTIIEKPIRQPVSLDPGLAQYMDKPAGLATADVQNALGKLCVPDITTFNAYGVGRIKIYQQYIRSPVTGKLTPQERQRLSGANQCNASTFDNYFEEQTFPKGIINPDLITLLNFADKDNPLPTNGSATSAQVRSKIGAARTSINNSQPAALLQDPTFSDQMTPDLWIALGKLKFQ
jgi:hypothetical protein